MGACKTQGVNTGQRYYFNEISDVMNGTEMGGDNINKVAAMEQRVSLICCLVNLLYNFLIFLIDHFPISGIFASFKQNIKFAIFDGKSI